MLSYIERAWVAAVAERVSLGQRVALLRRVRKLTQEELAERVGVSPQRISNWERGVSRVDSTYVPIVAEALGVTVAGLFNEAAGRSSRGRDTTSTPRQRGGEDLHAGDGGRVSEIYNATPHDEPPGSGVKPLPIYRWGSLGDPRDRESSPHPDREEYPPTGRERLIGANGFGVDVRGDSMVGREVLDGDVCWVNPDRVYRLGDLVLAMVSDGEGESGMVIKTYARAEVGDCLVSETIDGRSTVACSEFKIVGPVVWIQRGFPPR